MPINNIVASVTHIQCLKQGQRNSVATGFFYVHKDNLYLITNRHVVISEVDNYFPDEIQLRLHMTPSDLSQNADYLVPLYDRNANPLWLQHPQYGKEVDVVALPMDKDQISSRFFVKAFSESDHIPQDMDISIGEDVIVMGYPLGFHDALHNLPIVRNALMATVYPVPFGGMPAVLIDARLHRGTSGSPVLTKASNIIRRIDGSTSFMDKAVQYLVGVQSGAWDSKNRDPKIDEPLGLNLVWFASLIPEIITQGGNTIVKI